MKKELKPQVYFLNDNTELKIVTKTIPHIQLFIINKNGKIFVQEYSSIKKRNVEKKCQKSNIVE